MVVLKFGGTSVADAQPILRAAAIVSRQQGARVVVVSALAGVTDRLLQAAALARAGRGPVAQGVLDGLAQRHYALAAALLKSPAPSLTTALAALHDRATAILGAAADANALDAAGLDELLATGELMSSHIVSYAFAATGLPVM